MTYPHVLGEFETMQAVCAGRSIARYGDGEFKMSGYVTGIKSQEANPELTGRLRAILHTSGECLVGIPNILSDTPKIEHWSKFMVYARLLSPKQSYVSSFISRPDSAPWIDTPDYWALVESLWKGRDVTLVRGSGKSFTGDLLMAQGARGVTEIVQRPASNGRMQHAWVQFDELMARIGKPERVLIALGPTAKPMAVDLCAKGVHAIDVGHLGMFYKKHLRGEPMWVSEEEKAVDRVPAA